MNTVTIKDLKYYYLMVKELLLIDGVTSTDSNNREVVYLNNNSNKSIQKLKEILTTTGCFDFYSTNSGERIIGVSQIVYFLSKGYKAYNSGYKVDGSIHEVHHLNGNVQDNSPENLMLLSNFDHHIVTSFQRASIKSLTNLDILLETSSNWLSTYEDQIKTPFNNQGKSIREHKHFLCNVIGKTIHYTSTSKWLEKAVKNKIPIKKVNEFIERFNPDKYNPFDYQDKLLSETQDRLMQDFSMAEKFVFGD